MSNLARVSLAKPYLWREHHSWWCMSLDHLGIGHSRMSAYLSWVRHRLGQ